VTAVSPLVVLTDRLLLRPVRNADAEATAALMTPRVAASLSSWHSPMSVEEARSRVEKSQAARRDGTAVDFAIIERLGDRLVGWVGLKQVCPQRARLGYWIGAPFQGLGYGSEAAAAALRTGAGFLKASIVEASAREENAASIAILRKLGMSRCGTCPERMQWRNVVELCAVYELQLT